MKTLVFMSLLALGAAAAPATENLTRDKRGLLAAPVSYSSHYIHHAPAVSVAYHAPLPAVKIVQPLHVAKVVAPAVSYTKIAYPAVLPYYGHGYGYGYGHGLGYGFGHGFGHFH